MINRIGSVNRVLPSRTRLGRNRDPYKTIEELDKKHTEAVRYHKEIGKTAVEVKKERKEMQNRGEDAFKQVLNQKIEHQKKQ